MFSDIGKPIRGTNCIFSACFFRFVVISSVICVVFLCIDLLEEDFFFSQKFQFKAKNQSDFVVTGEADFGSRGPMANLSLFRKGSILSLDKLRIKSDGRILAEASLKTSDISTFTVSAEDGRQEPGKPLQSFGKLGVEIRSPTIMAQADVDVVNGPLLKGSFVYSLFKNLSFGAETLVNTHLEERNSYPELTDLNFGVAYSGPNWNLAARTTDTIGTMRFGYLQSISQRLTVGALLIYRLKANAQKLVFGAEYR